MSHQATRGQDSQFSKVDEKSVCGCRFERDCDLILGGRGSLVETSSLNNNSFEGTHTRPSSSESPSLFGVNVSSPTSEPQPHHGQPDETCRPDRSPRRAGGISSRTLDCDRDAQPTDAPARGTWHRAGQDQAHLTSGNGGSAEQGQWSKGQPPTTLPGLGSALHGQRDQGPTPEVRHDPHLREECPGPYRPGGIWEGSVPHLCRNQGGSAVLQLGEAHMAGEPKILLPSAGTPCPVAVERECQDGTGREPQDLKGLPERARPEGHLSQERTITRRQQQRCQQQCALLSDCRCSPDLDRDGEGAEGRDPRCQGREAQGSEDQLGLREFPQDLSAPGLDLSPEPSIASVTEPSTVRHVLPEDTAKQLERDSHGFAPKLFQDLFQQKRTVLMEVACSPNSVLSSEVQRQLGYSEAAVRCSIWNGCDLTQSDGVKLVTQQIDQLQPLHIWIATECGPFSPMQNLNQRTEAQRAELEKKRKDALRQYIGAACIWHYAVQRGIHVSWEWAHKCHAWRLPLIQELTRRYQPWFSTTNGCQVNLRDPKTTKLIHKGWKVMTTHQRLSKLLDLPCRCQKGTHAPCEGQLTQQSAFYTVEFAKRVCLAVTHELTHAMLIQEMEGNTYLPVGFGSGSVCVCGMLEKHGYKQQCGSCMEVSFLKLTLNETETEPNCEQAWVQTQTKGNMGKGKPDEHVKRQLYQLHAATGHGSIRHMVEALKKRGAPEYVLNLARDFRCHICDERHKVTHKHVASLEPLPPKWATVSADGGHWIHPQTGEHVEFALIIDEGSQFRVGRIMCRGKHKTMKASHFLAYLQEGWCQYFGVPQTLRLDPAGAFRSNEVEQFCDRHGVYLDFIPGEAHWKLGTCEQAIQGVKELMTKLTLEEPELSAEAALAEAIRMFNTRDLVRGFSPIQHALGRAPDEVGRCIQTLTGQSIEHLLPPAGPDHVESIDRMRKAEQIHAQWTAQQRINKALNSRGNRQLNYYPGDLVYYWRKQVSGSHSGQQRQKQGCFLGPGRILATETHRETDGTLRKGSNIWVIRGRRLIKCCPEQLRHATQREELLEHLTQEEDLKAPWTFQRLTAGLGGNEFEDITQEVPTETQWQEDQDEPMPPAPREAGQPRYRVLGKRIGEGPERALPEPTRQKRGGAQLEDALVTQEPWYEKTATESRLEAHGECFWAEDNTAVEMDIQLPQSKRQWQEFIQDPGCYFVGVLKRRAVEVNEKKLTKEDWEKFQEAKGVEVKNYIAARAFEALPPDMRPPREKAIKMRWLLTWKLKDDGTHKAKARAILLGYQDPGYEERETTSPVMTRQSRQFLLAAAGRYGWQVKKGDVTGAFLQGRTYPQELYCIPVPEICGAMGLEENSVTRVRRGCYGLVDAPLEWYRTVSAFLDSLGLVKSWADPCTWLWKPEGVLQGMISGHVDDFLFAGPQQDKAWQQLEATIQQHFKWTDWEENKFVQRGVLVERQSDGSFHLSQKAYVEKIPEIFLNATRKKELTSETTEREKSQLRATLGALSWMAQQTAPHVSAEVGLLLSEVCRSTVETIVKTNQLVHFAKAHKDHRLVIHAIPAHIPVGMFTWCDATGQNRQDGSSTQGLFVCLGPLSLLDGQVDKVIPIAWHSNKIDKQCRSPGAAEGRAAVAGEDHMYHARFQWGEMMNAQVNIFDVDSIVRSVPGCLISDSRNVYDKLQTTELTIRGAEKKIDLELLRLKHSQRETKVNLRWVHSEAQLGNSLTKGKTKELQMFYNLGFRWRLVTDDHMRSARKRRLQGLDALQEQPQQNSKEPQFNPSKE